MDRMRRNDDRDEQIKKKHYYLLFDRKSLIESRRTPLRAKRRHLPIASLLYLMNGPDPKLGGALKAFEKY